MEVNFTPEQEGVNSEQENNRFRAGVQKGLAAAARGDFIEEEEMDDRIARMLQS